jgi:hypothetical protein
MHALNEENEIRRAAVRLRQVLEDRSHRRFKVTWGFPNGDRHELDSCVLRGLKHDIYVGFSDAKPGVIGHIFKLVEHESDPTDAFYPNAEVNVSLAGTRRVAGIFSASETDVWLCHTALFNTLRKRIPRAKSLTYFRDFLVSVVDGNEEREIIPVLAFGSSTLSEDIEAFVLRVLELKERFKGGETTAIQSDSEGAPGKAGAAPSDPWSWDDGAEFEGTKASGNRDDVTYEYRHGPLCNRLSIALEAWVISAGQQTRLVVRRTINIDSALVGADKLARVIFEVKTAASLSDQLYKAIGQLLYYRRKRGMPDTHLVLVLPGAERGCAASVEAFLSDVGIHVVYEVQPGRFETSGRIPLEDCLHSLLTD